MSTVAAIATPLAVGGISVIRISGGAAIEIAAKVFSPMSGREVGKMAGYTCAYGNIFSGGRELDSGILTVFRAPKSYTGEDVAEISCHGGIFVTREVLRAVLSAGAEAAAAGEFTKRAFLNGKLSLSQAEAVMELISAEGEQGLRAAVAEKDGALFRRISGISAALLTILGELSAWVDYPDDTPEVEPTALSTRLVPILQELRAVAGSYNEGRILREGVETAIVGRPNVGKSTLMNLLTGFERSIVTEFAGTTRDIIEESVRLGDVVLRLADTAGLRDTADKIEQAGVLLAEKRLTAAELVLAVFDNSSELQHDDFKLIERLEGRRCVALINKCDKESLLDKEFIAEKFDAVVEISAKSGVGLDELERKICGIFGAGKLDFSAGVVANERQRRCVDRAVAAIGEALAALAEGQTLDAVTISLDEAEGELLTLTGERVTEAVVDEVFSHFCVGK